MMGKRLKILFLSNRSLLPIKDGHTRRSFNILKGLAAQHDVHFVSLYENQDELNKDNIKIIEEMCASVELIQAPKKTICLSMLLRLVISIMSVKPYTIWRHYTRDYHKLVEKHIASGNYDIVHCDNIPIAYTCMYNKSAFKSITDHDVSYLKCYRMASETNNIILKMFMYLESIKLKHYEKKALKLFDIGIVVSELDKIILKKLCPDSELVVIENGVDTDEFTPSAKVGIENNTLVWVGGFKPFSNENGMHFFLDNVYSKVKNIEPNVRLNIIGGNISDRLRKLIYSDSSIQYLGYVDDPVAYIQKAAVFIVPIISGSGTRLKLLEAMSAGKAIVTTDIGCEGVHGVNGIHYIIANTKQEFADAIVQLFRDHRKRESLEKNARILAVQKYKWTVINDKLDSTYAQVI